MPLSEDIRVQLSIGQISRIYGIGDTKFIDITSQESNEHFTLPPLCFRITPELLTMKKLEAGL